MDVEELGALGESLALRPEELRRQDPRDPVEVDGFKVSGGSLLLEVCDGRCSRD